MEGATSSGAASLPNASPSAPRGRVAGERSDQSVACGQGSRTGSTAGALESWVSAVGSVADSGARLPSSLAKMGVRSRVSGRWVGGAGCVCRGRSWDWFALDLRRMRCGWICVSGIGTAGC